MKKHGNLKFSNSVNTLNTLNAICNISTLFQRGLNVSWRYIETNLASEKYGFAERLISFILINEKIFFTIY